MSFLFPLYLLGALAVALPILLHLRKKPPKEKIPFGSLMFLEKSPEKLTRRTRLEKWLLLALRCLALLALALVFGRPYLKSSMFGDQLSEGAVVAIVVDRSASMQREDLAERAIAAAEAEIREYEPEDDLALIFFDREPVVIADFAEWQGLDARSRIGALKKTIPDHPLSWDIAATGQAMVEAIDQISTHAGDAEHFSKLQVVLISDFQEGADFSAINDVAWPESVSVKPIALAPKETGNLSLALAATTTEASTSAEMIHRVRISNTKDAENDKFQLAWKGDPATAIEGVVPPGSSRVIRAPQPSQPSESGQLVLTGDAHEFDNTVYIAPPQALPLDVAFASSLPGDKIDDVGSPYFYLKRALHATASLAPQVSSIGLDSLADTDAAAVVLHGDWTTAHAETARALAADGRLVIAMPSATTSSQSLSTLLGHTTELAEYEGERYAMLAELDFEHPVLVPFARAQIRDFTKVRFWKYRQLSFHDYPDALPEGIQSIARFDQGSPAWLLQEVDSGSIFTILSGWQPSESQFALSSKFVPVLYSILENAGYSAKAAPTYYVGEAQILVAGQEQTATRPGLFTRLDANQAEVPIAINLHPSQGRVSPVEPALLLTEFNVPLDSADPDSGSSLATDSGKSQQRLDIEEKEAHQKLWKWLVAAVLLFVLAETWLSGRRPSSTPSPSPATS